MIKVTRLDGTELVINAELIEFVESMPDTIVSLVTGKKIMVRESPNEVVHRVTEYRRLSSGPTAPKKAPAIEGAHHGG